MIGKPGVTKRPQFYHVSIQICTTKRKGGGNIKIIFLILTKGFNDISVAYLYVILFTEGYLEVDVKDLMTRYANDVIASCAFGLKVDSYMDENNQFYAMGKTAATFTFRQILMLFVSASFPRIFKVSIFKDPN